MSSCTRACAASASWGLALTSRCGEAGTRTATRSSTRIPGSFGGSADMGTARGAPFLGSSGSRERPSPQAGEHDIVVVGAPAGAAQTASMFLVGLPGAFTLPLVLLFGGAGGDDRG